MPKESRSKAALVAKAQQRAAELQHLEKAVAWCVENDAGPKAACKTGLFPNLTRSKIETAVAKHRAGKPLERISNRLMTATEEKDICDWIIKSGQNSNPAPLRAIGEQIVKVLKARFLFNKSKRFSPKSTTKLSKAALNAIQTEGWQPWPTFWQDFFARHWDRIGRYKPRSAEKSRVEKQTEAVVQYHFRGPAGLIAHLKHVGNWDEETSEIKDTRALGNTDETPQFFAYSAQGTRQQVACAAGTRPEKAMPLSREQASCNFTWAADGFQHASQWLFGREHFTEGMAVEAPKGTKSFARPEIYTKEMKSTRCLVSLTAKGVQTAASFVEFLEYLSADIDARSAAEVAEGRPPIFRPFTLMLDNHSSRYGPEVLAAAADAENRLGIALFTEEGKTSGFLQALDQFNAKWHHVYGKGRDEYMLTYESVYGVPLESIGIPEFLRIIGGDDDLDFPGIYFCWASALDVKKAWRRVGIVGKRIDDSQIDRTYFIDQAAPPAAAPQEETLEQKIKTPPGVRSGSQAAKDYKIRVLTEELERVQKREFSPSEMGLLEPRQVTKKQKPERSKARISATSGSMSLNNINGQTQAQEAERKAEAARVAAKKAESAAKKAAAEQEVAALEAAFELCKDGCACGGGDSCPAKGLARCETCSALKKALKGGQWVGRADCRVKACVDARKGPLLLGFNGPDDAGEAEGAALVLQ